MKMIFVSMGIENDVAVIQNRGVDGPGKDVPLAAISRTMKPWICGNLQFPGIDEQTSVTNIFNLHYWQPQRLGLSSRKFQDGKNSQAAREVSVQQRDITRATDFTFCAKKPFARHVVGSFITVVARTA